MLTLPNRKNKIDLGQYSYQKDIESRIKLEALSRFEIQVLEELLFSSLNIPLGDLLKSLDVSKNVLMDALEKIQTLGLISFHHDIITIDKEARKYFETHLAKFEKHFEPNIDFVQGLLKLLPIHILPLWYALPRTADHIFTSIFEKVFTSVRTYERYLAELNFEDPVLNHILKDLFNSPTLQLEAESVQKKYHLNPEALMESMLQLEYHFAAYFIYVWEDGHWKKLITPFSEWRKYLLHKKATTPKSHQKMMHFLEKKVLEKKVKSFMFTKQLATDRNLREMEKSLKNLIDAGWICFEDYLSHSLVCLNEQCHLVLKKQGKSWKYLVPVYTEEEKAFILGSLYGRFRDLGLIEIGYFQEKDYFKISQQGKAYFLSLLI